MNLLSRDLDKFLKTDGIQILIESGALRRDPSGTLVWVEQEESEEDEEDKTSNKDE